MYHTLLDKDNDSDERISIENAKFIGENALQGLGLNIKESQIVTNHLVDASMWGYSFAGLPRILAIAERPELKNKRLPLKIIKESPVSALIDGGNQLGYISVLQSVDIAIEKVKKSGVAIIGIRNSWFTGRAAYYLEKIALAGFASIYVVSSTPTVIPNGAIQKSLGTNPLAIGLPGKVRPFIFDIGTASVMSGEVLMKAFLGESFDEICGLNNLGEPTRIASEILQGGVFPFGGHKGFGLSLAIQALGLLAGSKATHGELIDFGYFFIAFDPELMMPLNQFTSELDELLLKIKNLPKQRGVEEIRIPSERGFREREIRRQQGILVSKKVLEKLREMGKK